MCTCQPYFWPTKTSRCVFHQPGSQDLLPVTDQTSWRSQDNLHSCEKLILPPVWGIKFVAQILFLHNMDLVGRMGCWGFPQHSNPNRHVWIDTQLESLMRFIHPSRKIQHPPRLFQNLENTTSFQCVLVFPCHCLIPQFKLQLLAKHAGKTPEVRRLRLSHCEPLGRFDRGLSCYQWIYIGFGIGAPLKMSWSTQKTGILFFFPQTR